MKLITTIEISNKNDNKTTGVHEPCLIRGVMGLPTFIPTADPNGIMNGYRVPFHYEFQKVAEDGEITYERIRYFQDKDVMSAEASNGLSFTLKQMNPDILNMNHIDEMNNLFLQGFKFKMAATFEITPDKLEVYIDPSEEVLGAK